MGEHRSASSVKRLVDCYEICSCGRPSVIVELTLAIGLTACTAGLTFFAWCEIFTMPTLFDPAGLLMPK
jgi:hypothetical protein